MGKTVNVVDSHGRDAKCVTDESGKCSVFLVQTYVSSEAGNATLRKETRNPQKVTISADGCRSLTYEFESKSAFEERKSLDCSVPPRQ